VVDNATYQGDYIIGTSAVVGAGVEIEVWTHDFTNSQGQVFHWTGEFTRSQCIPVESHVEGPGYFFQESFVNIVPGTWLATAAAKLHGASLAPPPP
jgi:hypothetical protein